MLMGYGKILAVPGISDEPRIVGQPVNVRFFVAKDH